MNCVLLEKPHFTWGQCLGAMIQGTVVSHISIFFASSIEKGVLEILPGTRVRCSAVAMLYPRGSCFSALGAGSVCSLDDVRGSGQKELPGETSHHCCGAATAYVWFFLWGDWSLVILCLLLMVVFS